MAKLKRINREVKTIEDCLSLLNQYSDRIDEDSLFGELLRDSYERVKEYTEHQLGEAKIKNPLAFVIPSYQQSLKLNAWVWGVNLVLDFDANRIGKTACGVFNALLWLLPNIPEYQIFKPHTDKWGRTVHVLPRPKISTFIEYQDFLEKNPNLVGDPLLPLDHPDNAKKFAKLQKHFPEVFHSAFPEPPFLDNEGEIWLGTPDNAFFKDIILKEWKKWLPKEYIERVSEHDLEINLRVPYKTRFGIEKVCKWNVLGKSYESKDTKWSGAAVRGIVLTEGLSESILSEIRQRFTANSFGSWDYTPYEARNVGKRSSLAHRVYAGKEELPLRKFIFSGFGIDKVPDYILPDRKKKDMIRAWGNKPEAQARIHGKFFTSSPLALSNLDREFHTIPWSKEELFKKYPTGILVRAYDSGYDHPSCCLWALLTPQNVWFVYRCWLQDRLSIGQRCEKIIELSNNERKRVKWGSGPDDYVYQECHTKENSEVILFTVADYHIFKEDEETRQPYSYKYVREGLVLRRSVTLQTRDRVTEVDRLLERNDFMKHPHFQTTPGSRIYFLINEPGVDECVEKLTNLFWARYAQGSNKGEPKDQLQDHEDDEFDTLSYLVCSPLRWDPSIRAERRLHVDTENVPFAKLQTISDL